MTGSGLGLVSTLVALKKFLYKSLSFLTDIFCVGLPLVRFGLYRICKAMSIEVLQCFPDQVFEEITDK